jgi:hypothetical protein
MFILNFVVQFLNKRHFRSKIGDIAPLNVYVQVNTWEGGLRKERNLI